MERRRANFKVCIELVVAAPEVLSRTALALPPWPINMERLGPGKLLESGREKHIKKEESSAKLLHSCLYVKLLVFLD